MRKQSKRVLITQNSIESAYLVLLKNKNTDKITVKEVCDMAMVNRTTFYKYYSDIVFLAEKVRSSMLKYLEDCLKESIPADLSDSYEFISRIILGIKRDPNLRMLPFLYNEPQFKNSLNSLIYRYYLGPKFGGEISDEEWVKITYCSHGVLGLIEDWVDSGMQISPEKISNSVIAFAKCIREM